MDEFRVDSSSPYARYGEQALSDSSHRKKGRPPKRLPSQPEDLVVLSDEAEETGEVLEDSYSPSEKTGE